MIDHPEIRTLAAPEEDGRLIADVLKAAADAWIERTDDTMYLLGRAVLKASAAGVYQRCGITYEDTRP